jgi:hypothetical protein
VTTFFPGIHETPEKYRRSIERKIVKREEKGSLSRGEERGWVGWSAGAGQVRGKLPFDIVQETNDSFLYVCG